MEYTLALDNNSAWLLGTGVTNFVRYIRRSFPSGGRDEGPLLAHNTTNGSEEAPIQGYEVMRYLDSLQDKAHRVHFQYDLARLLNTLREIW